MFDYRQVIVWNEKVVMARENSRVNAFTRDSSAALFVEGELVAARDATAGTLPG